MSTRSASRHTVPRSAPAKLGLNLDVRRETSASVPAAAALRAWAEAAVGRAGRGRELGVRIVGERESRRLNHRFRGRDKPTNVLSFPASEGAAAHLLGDLVICPQVLRAEAKTQRKTLQAHWAHLVVHGVLHLIGYDHERASEAPRMERREVRVLRRLGFANPYRAA